jgi:ABC-type amino acid transport substrate-binding protein
MTLRLQFKLVACFLFLSGLFWTGSSSAETVRFGVAEKLWLGEHTSLRIGMVEMTPPILFFSGGANPQGLVADYLRALALHLGLPLQITQYSDWRSLTAALKDGEVDLIGAAVPGLPGRDSLVYSRPYLSLPAALFGSESMPQGGLEALQDKSVAVVRGDIWAETLPALASGVKILSYPGLPEALRAVSEGRAFAYLGDAASANYQLRRGRYDGIKEQLRLDLSYDVALASPADRPELQSLLQKGLDRISRQELREIWHRWPGVARPRDYGSDFPAWLYWLMFVFAWTLLVAWATVQLARRRIGGHETRLRQTIRRLRQREKRLQTKQLLLKARALAYRKESRTERSRLQFLDEVMPNAAWIWDPSEEQCQWDEAMHSLYRRMAEEFVPTPEAILECVHVEDRERVAGLFDRRQEAGESRLSYRIYLPDGSLRWLLDYSQFNSDETEGGQRVGICWDISDYIVTEGVESG